MGIMRIRKEGFSKVMMRKMTNNNFCYVITKKNVFAVLD